MHGESAHLTLSALHNLSMVFEQAGRAQDAVRVDEQILRGRTALLGETHPQTLATMNNLASKYTALGRLDDARRLLRQAIGTGERVFGAEHPQLGVFVHSLGEVEIASQNFREAEGFITRAVAIYRPQRAQFLGLALYQLAQVVARQGRSREAVAYLGEAIAAGYKPSVAPDADPHLTSLQSLPEFQATVAGMKNAK